MGLIYVYPLGSSLPKLQAGFGSEMLWFRDALAGPVATALHGHLAAEARHRRCTFN